MGVYNEDIKENEAFFSFTKTFLKHGLNVPAILGTEKEKKIYLLQDLGDLTLFSFLTEARKEKGFSSKIIEVYKKVLEKLPEFQIVAGKNIDYSKCYPRDSFDRQSMMWDMNYFKYYFLKLAKIPFDEQLLEDDFHKFADFLLQADSNYFLYRDFQSRNIMLVDGEPYFIDYQGGRKGALQYDVASLLYDAKADIPQIIRNQLLEFYLNELEKYIKFDKEQFRNHYYGYVIIRIMQAMGAYGFRGFYEKKKHFLASIPYAMENLRWIVENVEIPVEVPNLIKVLKEVSNSEKLKKLAPKVNPEKTSALTVSITSFSYKKGIPVDETGNGGGFVFDCRAIHNPGKYDEYKELTGMDLPVQQFLAGEQEMDDFLTGVFMLVDQSVEKYISRGFQNLMVNFGCTGGQHRSVYSAEMLAKHLKSKYPVKIILKHREQEEKK
ncbi:MAG: phosphotransferase [Bacteroidales bacterium]|nr:phosphotransferase [Bacteroidales bacterium]